LIEVTTNADYIPLYRKSVWKDEWTTRIQSEHLPYEIGVVTNDDYSPWVELLPSGNLRCAWCNSALYGTSPTGFKIAKKKTNPSLVGDHGMQREETRKNTQALKDHRKWGTHMSIYNWFAAESVAQA